MWSCVFLLIPLIRLQFGDNKLITVIDYHISNQTLATKKGIHIKWDHSKIFLFSGQFCLLQRAQVSTLPPAQFSTAMLHPQNSLHAARKWLLCSQWRMDKSKPLNLSKQRSTQRLTTAWTKNFLLLTQLKLWNPPLWHFSPWNTNKISTISH